MDAAAPLVSCVLPTQQHRREFFRQALRYYLRQTWQPRELIVVDDPGEPLTDLPASVRYLQPATELGIGAKLNLGIERARGGIIQKMDDDDFYGPRFLESTVAAITAQEEIRTIVAADRYPVLIAASGDLRLVSHSFAGGTLCFRRELWRRVPFRDVVVAEDKGFLEDTAATRLAIDGRPIYMYVRHGRGHAWSQLLVGSKLGSPGRDVTTALAELPQYPAKLADLLPEQDVPFYEGLRGVFPGGG